MIDASHRNPGKRILLVDSGVASRTEHFHSFRRAFEATGHQVFVISKNRHPSAFIREGDSTTPKFDAGGIPTIVQKFSPSMIVVPLSQIGISDETQIWARQARVLTVSIRPGISAPRPSGFMRYLDSFAEGSNYSRTFLPGIDRAAFKENLFFSRNRWRLFSLDYSALVAQGGDHIEEIEKLIPLVNDDSSPRKQIAISKLSALHLHLKDAKPTADATWRVLKSLSSGSAVLVQSGAPVHESVLDLPQVLIFDDAEHLIKVLSGLNLQSVEGLISEGLARMSRELIYEDQLTAALQPQADLEDSSRLYVDITGRSIDTKPARTRPPIVAIAGWYGEQNFGDELILESIAQAIERLRKDAQVVVACPKPAIVERTHGFAGYSRQKMSSMADLARYADCLVIGGGGIWNDKGTLANGGLVGLVSGAEYSVLNLASVSTLFTSLGKPVVGLGLGVGPLHEESAKAAVRTMVLGASSVNVRDRNSARILEELGGRQANVSVSPDLGYAYQLPRGGALPHRDQIVIGLNLRELDDTSSVKLEVAATLREAFLGLRSEVDFVLKGLPLHADDTKVLSAFFDSIPTVKSHIANFSIDIDETFAEISNLDAFVSMRLHGAVMAHRSSVSVIGIDYEEKISGYFGEQGKGSSVIDRSTSATAISAMLREAILRDSVEYRISAAQILDNEERSRAALDAHLAPLVY